VRFDPASPESASIRMQIPSTSLEGSRFGCCLTSHHFIKA
jgi:hypothetical protein